MDYLTRRDCAIAYGTRSVRLSTGRLPLLEALGPRYLFREHIPGMAKEAPALLVPEREVSTALEDLDLTKRVGPLPLPIASDYPARHLNLLDAIEVEKLLERTGLTKVDLEARSKAFFDELLEGSWVKKKLSGRPKGRDSQP